MHNSAFSTLWAGKDSPVSAQLKDQRSLVLEVGWHDELIDFLTTWDCVRLQKKIANQYSHMNATFMI